MRTLGFATTADFGAAAARKGAWAGALAIGAMIALAPLPAVAAGGLDGSWSGGGSVSFSSGSKEPARCRARYSRVSSTSYEMSATCATSAGKVTQTATLVKSGNNSYVGNFQNTEYGVTGTIRVKVSGNSQTVNLTSTAGSAYFRLSK